MLEKWVNIILRAVRVLARVDEICLSVYRLFTCDQEAVSK